MEEIITKKERPAKSLNVIKFKNICIELCKLYEKKNKDYGNSFHNTYKEFGVIPCVSRMNDKMERIKNLAKGNKAMVENESLIDTLTDIAAYAIMTRMELEREAEVKNK